MMRASALARCEMKLVYANGETRSENAIGRQGLDRGTVCKEQQVQHNLPRAALASMHIFEYHIYLANTCGSLDLHTCTRLV